MNQPLKIFIACVSTMISPLLHAEGAARELACIINMDCDASGACRPANREISFRMEPLTVSDDASGTYLIRYEDSEARMQSLSFAGPFHWATDKEMNTLLASSETDFLWHHLALQPVPEASIRFMRCRFTQ